MTTAYVDPNTIHTPASGASIPASWGTVVRSDLQTLATPPGCIARRTAAQATASGIDAAISLTATDIRDTDNYHDPAGANPSRITIPAGLGGLYMVSYNVGFDPSATGYRQASVKINNSSSVMLVLYSSVAAVVTWLCTSAPIALSAGDYIELVVNQNAGALNTSTSIDTRLSAIWMGVA